MTSISVIQNGDSASLRMEPFPYLLIEPALPEDLYAELARDYPEQAVVRQGGHESETNCRYFAAAALAGQDLSPIWRSFLEYHVSPAFYREATELIMPALEKWYPDRLDFIRRAHAVARDMGKGDIDLDTQFVINLPCDESVRSPHLDNPRELFAILFYMRPEDDESCGGDLEIYDRRIPEVRMRGFREASPADLTLADTVSYGTNKVLMFLNTAVSYHGVSPRTGSGTNRRYMNIMAEVSKRRDLLLRRKKPWF